MRRSHLRTSATFDEAGQAIVFVVVAMIALIAVVGLVVDIGYAFRTQRALQAAADASALAGAQQLPDPAQATQTAAEFGASTVGKNQITNVSVNEQVLTSCVATIPGCSPVNAISVSEAATVPAFFAKILGFASFKVHANATACSPCGSKPVDIMLVLDRTGSMCQDSTGKADPSCADLNNAKAGIKTFLDYFDPVQAHIGLAVLPPATNIGAKCNAPPSSNNYNYNLTTAPYLLVPLSSDFRNTDGTLNNSSNLVSTVTCVQGAGATAYANAIEAAQAELNLHGRPKVPRVIVFFSDGAANTGPSFAALPYRAQPCNQGVTSAGVAKAAGTTIYSIGYALDDATGGCMNSAVTPNKAETPAITVYGALGGIASDPSKFFVKPNPGQLQSIYTAIAQDISHGSSSLIG
jgi:Putative Flp pilus-assembly TadE/G-like/von Willebrand factor type A domain